MKRRHYPGSVKIRNRHYKLHLSPTIEEGGKDSSDIVGWCDDEERLIVLLSTEKEQDLFKTFIHEVLHAMEREYKLKIPHKLVYGLEEPIAKFLKDNFHLIPRR